MTKTILTLAALLAFTGCTRIETGEVGIRIDMNKQIETSERMPGSWNQTIMGDILTFPVKDITLAVEDRQPLTSDNSALADLDFNLVYSINPTSVAELYSTKARGFHAVGDDRDIYLMYNYITTLANNAAYKAVRQYKSLEVADNRAKIEQEIRDTIVEALTAEKLNGSITITAVQVRNVQPNAQILQAATDYVKSQNELKVKENEVRIAKLEAERMSALAANSEKSIQYMNAQASLMIAEGIKNGKVNTIVVPADFKGMVNVK